MENSKQFVPVLLLTGYLGSGKTTLLNRILSNRKGIKFAVIVNDLGEVNVDAALIEKGGVVGQKDDSLVALQNGCICCTLKMDLVQQLDELTRDGKFDYIVIEASGICEPAPIAQTICSIPSLGPEYHSRGPVARMDCIATVVDALRMQSEFNCGDALPLRNFDEDDIENLLIQQIEFCNIVILNKVAEVGKADLGRMKQIIRNLQPKAEIIECNFCDFDLGKILDTGMFDFDQVATRETATTMSTNSTTRRRERRRNTASAPLSTTAATPSTSTASTTMWQSTGRRASYGPRASAISTTSPTNAISSSRRGCRSRSRTPDYGSRPCPTTNLRT